MLTILKNILKIVLLVLVAYFVYVAASLIISTFVKNRESLDFEFTDSEGSVRVLSIDENTDALSYRLAAIDSAEEEIIISTFKIENDNSACTVLAALYKAAQRGVDIRIIIDGLNGWYYLNSCEEFKALASMENVQVRFYNKVNLLKPWLQNYHLHDKYIIIDDSIYILGGRNIAQMALSEYDSSNTDRDVLVYECEPGENTSLAQLKEYFEMVWNLDESEDKVYRCSDKVLEEGFESLEAYYSKSADIDWEAVTYAAESIQILTNPVNAVTSSADVWESICELMAAGDEVIIQTPYIMCDSQMYEDLAAVCAASDVEMIINSPVTGNNVMGSVDYLNNKNKIYATGVTTYEWYGGGHSSHAKTILIDDNISIIGSYNFDMRSNYLDTEIMLVIDCPELNAQLKEGMEILKDESKKITADGVVSYGDGFVSAEQPFLRKCIYAILRVLIVPFRHLI